MTGRSASDSAGLPAALEGCLDACRRCQTLVRHVREAEAGAAERVYSAIGPHLRHCMDHLDCLLRGLETGEVDYDARDRETVLETDSSRMAARMAELVAELVAIDPAIVSRRLHVRQTAALGAPAVRVESNLERELVFLSGHTIHHIAIMTILARDRGVALPEGLDMAFSTAAHAGNTGLRSR